MKARPFPSYATGRVIFALSLSRARLAATVLKSDIRNILVSYHFVYSQAKTYTGSRSMNRLMYDLANRSDCVFIDSGVFTIRNKLTGSSVAQGDAAVLAAGAKNRSRIIREHWSEIKAYVESYGRWLRQHPDLWDWAFDMDVDQFLGVPIADQFYAYLSDQLDESKRIIRIWHSTRSWDDWKKWCESGQYAYLAVGGGQAFGYDPHFYRRFVEVAHKNGVKMHVLAATDPKFMQQVDFDTGDSSSWTAGSRYGYIFTPFGEVTFATNKFTAKKQYWGTMPDEMRHKVETWLKSKGLPSDLRVYQKKWQWRELANIACFLEQDRPYEDKEHFRQVTFLD